MVSFSNPFGVACNSRGDIVVAEFGNHRVQVFDKTGKFLFKFGSKGNGNGQFSSPVGVTVDRRNNQIVVADLHNHRIQVFDEKGGFIRAFGSREVVMVNLVILLVSWLIHKGITLLWRVATIVSFFNSNGQFLRKFGSSGNGNGQLSSPRGISLTSNGNVVVCVFQSLILRAILFVIFVLISLRIPTTSSLIPMTTS